MTTKSDKTVAQPAVQCNENRFDQAAKGITKDMETIIREEIAQRADLNPESLFVTLQSFAVAMARASQELLDLMEDLMGEKDPTYPKGLMTPAFLASFLEGSQGHCQFIRIPEELVERLSEELPGALEKETLH